MAVVAGIAGARPRLIWQRATVRNLIQETPYVKSMVLDVPHWTGHRAGQHLDVRLTAEDGYQFERLSELDQRGDGYLDEGAPDDRSALYRLRASRHPPDPVRRRVRR